MLHWAFDTMVGICSAMIALGLWFAFVWWRRRDIPRTPWFLRAVAVSGVAGVVALECGWIVTEVGRQPWIVYRVMRTTQAVTSADGLEAGYVFLLAVYVALAGGVLWLLRRLASKPPSSEVEGPVAVAD